MITVDKGFIASFISKQSPTESEASITEHSHVSVLLFQLCFIINKPLQNFNKFYMHIKAKTLHFFYAKKHKVVQNQEKSLWCILNSSSPKKALCQVWLKLVQWFWRRFLNFVSVFSPFLNYLPLEIGLGHSFE